MLHERHRPALSLKTRQHLPTTHARLDELECHLAPDRLLLKRAVNHAKATFAEWFQQAVGTDDLQIVLRRCISAGPHRRNE